MNEEKIIRSQLIKNMILNLITFTLIFTILGIIIYTQVTSSLFTSSDNELMNNKNRIAIKENVPKIDEKENDEEILEPPSSETINNFKKIINDAPNPRLLYIYRDKDGNVIRETGNYNNEYFETVEFDSNSMDEIYNVVVNGEYLYRGVNFSIEGESETKYVQVLINIDAEKDIIENFSHTLIIAIIICIILSIIASYILSKKTLRPIIISWKKQNEFVQNASHELRTPLTIIQAKEELLLEEPNSKIIDKAEDITTVLNETRRLSKLVKDLMALARADSNKTELNKEKVNIDEFIKEVAKPFIEIATLDEKKFIINTNYKKEIYVDKNKIHQLLVIVLDNALKYTEKKEKIEINTFEKEGKFVLEIADTGIGISDEGLKRIFDRFYREDKARSRETGGSGLGLSIAQFIVEQHGGTIRAMHNKPKGTKIEIRFK